MVELSAPLGGVARAKGMKMSGVQRVSLHDHGNAKVPGEVHVANLHELGRRYQRVEQATNKPTKPHAHFKERHVLRQKYGIRGVAGQKEQEEHAV